jgi:hypothetical protein
MERHPSEVVGFMPTHGTERHGQVEDWVCPMPDGSRMHAHVMPDGRVFVHRDRFDPDRSTFHRAAHVVLETKAGQLGLALTAARWLGWLP